MCFYFGQLFEG